ncbi:MAG: SPASM domain-containing protein [Verrucomicrobiota bacterium]
MITLTSLTKQGRVVERQYDTRTAKFFTPAGERIRIEKGADIAPAAAVPQTCDGAPKPKRNMTPTSPKYRNRLTRDTKSPDPKLIRIQLGLSCNYACSHCKQSVHVEDAVNSSMKDVDDFIAHFDDWCVAPREDTIQIHLWGGEPLVYFAKIKKLVPFLRSRFDHASIFALSNGSLVDKEIADYFIENDIALGMSHDGPGQTQYRKEDPLAEGSDSLKWIKYYLANSKNGFGANAVLSKQNCDPQAVVDHIRGVLGEKVHVGFEGIVVVENEAQFGADALFSDDDYAVLRDNIRGFIASGNALHVAPFNRKFNALMDAWTNPKFFLPDNLMQKCGLDDNHTLAVNLQGDVLLCQSDTIKIGTLDDLPSVRVSNSKSIHWHDRAECPTCPVLTICGGGCMTQAGNEWYYSCNNEFHFNLAIFEAAYEFLFDERIIALSGDALVRPKKKAVMPIKTG